MAAFEVLALDTATPQIRAPGASDTYTFPRAVELPLGTANGVLYLNGSKVVTSGSALTFDGTNLATTGNITLENARYYQSKTSGGSTIRMLGLNSANTAYVGPIDAGPGDMILNASSSSANIQFYVSGGESMRLNSTGLGIGTNNPLAKLSLSASGNPRTTNGASSISLNNTVTTRSAIIGYDDSQNLVLWNSTNASGATQFYTGTGSGTLQMTLNSSGNLGLGVTPSAWQNGVAIQARGWALWDSGTNDCYIAQNSFYNGSSWVYRNSFGATTYLQTNGLHIWYSAPSGTAGNTFGFSQTMLLNARGDLGIGGVTPPTLNGVSGLAGNYLNVIGGSGVYLSGNAYYDSAWKYYGTGTAGEYEIVNGEHRFRTTSVSGTAGNTISFTQAMTLDASGNLMVGTTTQVGRMHIKTGKGSVAVTESGSIGTALALYDSSGTRTASIYNYGGSNEVLEIASNLATGFVLLSTGSPYTERMRIDSNGNVIINTAAIATNATNGFLYVPTCAGTPTGTPTTYTGRSPIVVDTTNNKLYFYSGGAWRDAGP